MTDRRAGLIAIIDRFEFFPARCSAFVPARYRISANDMAMMEKYRVSSDLFLPTVNRGCNTFINYPDKRKHV